MTPSMHCEGPFGHACAQYQGALTGKAERISSRLQHLEFSIEPSGFRPLLLYPPI